MTTPLVLYHGHCWDGFCAAWVARMALGQIEAVPVHYGQPAPDVQGREVYILDFCYPHGDLAFMGVTATSVLVLDHHKTAAEELAELTIPLPALRYSFEQDKSGGRMAWEHFAHIGGWEGMKSPWLVDYTEDRDLWRHALPESHNINAALRSYPLDFALWDKFNQDDPMTFVQEGHAIRRRERQIIADHVRHARRKTFDGTYTVPVVNATVLFSEIAGELAKDQPFAACYFDRQDGKRQWSLRSGPLGVDVSEIAKQHGGGGHKHAAGFEEDLTKPGGEDPPVATRENVKDVYAEGITMGQQLTAKHLAGAMRKVLPPQLFEEVVAHLDPLTPFLKFLARHPQEEP